MSSADREERDREEPAREEKAREEKAREEKAREEIDEGIAVSADDGVLRIRIDRPERKGSLTPAAVRRIIEVLESAGTDDTLRVVLLSGTGDDFCTGSDVVAANKKSGGPKDADGTESVKPRPGSLQRRTALQAHRLIAVMLETQLPIVCAVRGWAAGLGCQLALAADFTVASNTSTFWLPFTGRGFTPDSGATWLLPRLIGVARAKDMLMLGREVSGETAAEWGMIHAAVNGADLDAAAEELVGELCGSATVALGLTKRCIHSAMDGGVVDAMADEALALELSARTADFREGLAAFKERRDPRFEGR
jgi:2-(1,2-epoxy-1,2-dihydrophenyl)acetyl-CoA isomerase